MAIEDFLVFLETLKSMTIYLHGHVVSLSIAVYHSLRVGLNKHVFYPHNMFQLKGESSDFQNCLYKYQAMIVTQGYFRLVYIISDLGKP